MTLGECPWGAAPRWRCGFIPARQQPSWWAFQARPSRKVTFACTSLRLVLPRFERHKKEILEYPLFYVSFFFYSALLLRFTLILFANGSSEIISHYVPSARIRWAQRDSLYGFLTYVGQFGRKMHSKAGK